MKIAAAALACFTLTGCTGNHPEYFTKLDSCPPEYCPQHPSNLLMMDYDKIENDHTNRYKLPKQDRNYEF